MTKKPKQPKPAQKPLIPSGYLGDKAFEQFLDELGLSLDCWLMRSLIRDELVSHPQPSPLHLLPVLLPENMMGEQDLVQEFLNFFGGLWNELAPEYFPVRKRNEHESLIRFRKLVLGLQVDTLRFLRSLDRIGLPPERFPRDLLTQFGRLDGMLANILRMMEMQGFSTMDDEPGLEKEVELLRPIHRDLQQRILDAIKR